MANYVGQNRAEIDEKITPRFFGPVRVVDFQKQFNFLHDAKPEILKTALTNAIIEVEYDLQSTIDNFKDFDEYQSKQRLTAENIKTVFERAVFDLATVFILTTETTTNTTKDGAARQDNLSERINECNISARKAIAMLQSDIGIKVEVV